MLTELSLDFRQTTRLDRYVFKYNFSDEPAKTDITYSCYIVEAENSHDFVINRI